MDVTSSAGRRPGCARRTGDSAPLINNRLLPVATPRSGHSVRRMRRRATKILTVPVHVTEATAPEHGLPRWAAKTRPHRRPVIPGVHEHPFHVRHIQVPEWTDDRWIDQRNFVAAVQVRRPDAVLSHLSAARHFGWPIDAQLPWNPVSVTPRRTDTKIPNLRRHKPRELEVDVRDGITVATEPEVLRQISSALSEDELVAVVDAICGPWSGPDDRSITPAKVWDTLTGLPRFRGSRALQRAIGRACVDVGSPQETRLRLLLIRAGLPTPVVAHAIRTAGGVVHPDLAYPDLRIAIEYDGDHHRTSRQQWSHDIERERWVRGQGWDYIRVTSWMPDGQIVHMVREAISERTGP